MQPILARLQVIILYIITNTNMKHDWTGPSIRLEPCVMEQISLADSRIATPYSRTRRGETRVVRACTSAVIITPSVYRKIKCNSRFSMSQTF